VTLAVRLRTAFTTVFRALSNAGYRKFLLGLSISWLGAWMQTVAQGLLVLKLGGSGVDLGLTVMLQVGPMAALAPLGGVWADRFDRRKLLFIANAVGGAQALALAMLVATGHATLPVVYGMAFLLGAINAVLNPAQQAFTAEIVEPDDLANAVNLNLMTTNVARVMGPAVAGLIVATAGIATCFFLNAASFVVAIGVLLLIRADQRRVETLKSWGRGHLREGIAHVSRNRDLAAAWWMNFVYAMLAWQFEVSIPLIVTKTFGGSASSYGLMFSAVGMGAVIGGAWGASRIRPTHRDHLLAAVVGGAGMLATAFAPNLPIAIATCAIAGGAIVCWWGILSGIFQIQADPTFRARVTGLWQAGLHGGRPFGALLVGWAAAHLGARWPFILGALGCVISIAVWTRVSGVGLREAFTSRKPIAGFGAERTELDAFAAESEMISKP